MRTYKYELQNHRRIKHILSDLKVLTEAWNHFIRAKDLLEHAKRAVEIALEQDEQAAIDWLESVSEVV